LGIKLYSREIDRKINTPEREREKEGERERE
jgi:hypothetical protein